MDDRSSREDEKRLDSLLKLIKDTFLKNRQIYGDSWKNDGMGPQSLLCELNAKLFRLKGIMWNKESSTVDWNKASEVSLDASLYALLLIMKADIENNVDFAKVQKIIDES